MIFTEKDKEAVRKFIQIKNRGYFVNSKTLQDVYNRVLEKNLNPTNCGSCLRARVTELEKALRQWEEQERKEAEIKAQETLKQEEPTLINIKEEIKEEPTEPKKRGRKPKKVKEE